MIVGGLGGFSFFLHGSTAQYGFPHFFLLLSSFRHAIIVITAFIQASEDDEEAAILEDGRNLKRG